MSFVIRKRTILILVFAFILVLSVYLMFLGNFPRVVYEKQIDSVDLEKVSISPSDENQAVPVIKNLEKDFL